MALLQPAGPAALAATPLPEATQEFALQEEKSSPQLQRGLDAYAAVEFGNQHLGPSQGRLNEAFRKEQASTMHTALA